MADSRIMAFEMGIPATYAGEPAFVILHRSLYEMYTVLRINRGQLTVLSIILAVLAALLAAFLTWRFVRPIRVIKDTVDSLAKGDLTAAPNITLRDEIGRLSDSVEELGKALQRVDVLRQEVIANVSHELRSPLALITGYAEMVRDINWKDEDKRNADLNLIIQEARRMSEMVSDIMDYSQFQAGYISLKKEWYSLWEIVESEILRCGKTAAVHRIRVSLESPESESQVFVDALKISQVIRNLLYNAINHTADGDIITVTVTEHGGGWKAAIANPGDPIPEEDRNLIWERYQRSQHQGGRRQGTGIGLSIVSTILRAHGMDYGVECRDGRTVFWFTVPEHTEL
ncbi:HAMP domain-containing histidine kinase [Brucepastera parasyntrophica]|uniref:sensor histidine kinase n=1 Tax=Brucepastera parasyntrophica TaxID=2880008 RepID=UPI00210BF763|nr:HAMP domain-containing sensor histidine kinase [Brucepastera parasyntrophica]ULQ60442.1 HAMP domain-containing histidine kinase [Brucepastera parasyntrophica]